MANSGSPVDFAGVRQLTQEHVNAMASRDVTKLLELNSDSVVYLPPRRDPIVGKAAVKQMFEMFFAQFSSIEQSATPSEIAVYGDHAIAWGPEALKLTTHSGQVIEMKGHGMTLMERHPDGSWKFTRGINNLMPIKP